MIDLSCSAAVFEGHTIPMRPTSPSRTLERAKDFIELHLGDEDLSPRRIAAGVGISTRYLSDLFAAGGTTPMSYLRERRLIACKTAFSERNWESGLITQVAFTHGFRNISNFNRVYKERFGQSPRNYMNKN